MRITNGKNAIIIVMTWKHFFILMSLKINKNHHENKNEYNKIKILRANVEPLIFNLKMGFIIRR